MHGPFDAAAAFAQIDEAMAEWSKRGFHIEHYYELLARMNFGLALAANPAAAAPAEPACSSRAVK